MKNISTVLLLFLSTSIFATDYYWVGGTGNWSDFSNHWATTSGGASFHTQAPSSTDDVYFDINSFAVASQVVTLDVEASCGSMDWTGVLNFPSINGNGQILNIYGSLVLAADMTADFRYVEFESTTTGNTITTNGTSLGTNSLVRLNGIGGEWDLQDNFNTNNLYIIAGTLNTNNNNINSGKYFQTSGASPKVLNLGSSEITSERWWIFGTNQTINAGTSKIITSLFYGDNEGDGPFTYYDVEFYNYGKLRNTSSFNEITIPAGLDLQLQAGDVFTINNLVATGTKHEPILIRSETEGAEATFNKSTGSINVSYVELQDIHATGGATFTANSSVDNGNTTGWNINAISSLDYYWVGNSGDWTDYANHWATTSGGSTMHTDYPSKYDNLIFDANSFTISSQTVTNDLSVAKFHNMDWTGVLNSPTFQSSYPNSLYAYGYVSFGAGVTKSIHTLQLNGDETGLSYSDLSAGSVSYITFNGSGTYDLLTNINTGTLAQYSGTVNYNNVDINCSIDFKIGNGSSSPTLNLSTSTITCRDLVIGSAATPSITIGTSTLTIERDLIGYGASFYEVVMDGGGDIVGSNTFEHFTIQPGSSVTLEAGETQTINQSLTLDGTKASPINLNSDASGVQGTLSMSSGTVDATYLILKDIAATGGATFNATQTIDNGNNTGWNITSIVGEDYYWVGNSGNWSDFANHWVTTSGGSTFHITVPGVLDNVIFDANSFTLSGQVVTVDNDQANFNDIDASAVTQDFTISGSGKEFNIYGSVNIPALANVTVDTYNFLSTDIETLSFNNGPGSSTDFNFSAVGDWTFTTDLTVGSLVFNAGTINTNGSEINANSLQFFGTESKTINFSTSTINTGSFTVYDFVENVTINGGSSNLSIGGSLKTESDVNTISLNNLTFNNSGSAGDGLVYDNLNLNTFTIEAGKTVKPVGDITITTNDFVAVGTDVDPIIISPQTGGSSLTISQSSGVVDAYFLELEEVSATGGAIFNAYNSIDNGNVFGWIFHKDNQTIDFSPLSDKVYGDPDFDLEATATSGLTVTFSIISGPATIIGNTLSMTGIGTVQVKAEQAGNIDYNPAPSVTQSFEVLKAHQTITFETIPSKTFGDPDFDLVASSDKNLAITFESADESIATISGSTVTIVGAGETTITALQEGNSDINAAQVEQVLIVNKADQTITFEPIEDQILEESPLTLIATASSGLEVTFEIVNGPASLTGNEVSFNGLGTVTIKASQEGNNNFMAASPVEQSFEIISITAVNTDISDNKINYFPNPVADVLYVKLADQINKKVLINLFDTKGRLVYSTYSNPHLTLQELHLDDLLSGIYILKINGIINDQKIVLKN